MPADVAITVKSTPPGGAASGSVTLSVTFDPYNKLMGEGETLNVPAVRENDWGPTPATATLWLPTGCCGTRNCSSVELINVVATLRLLKLMA